MSLVSSRYFLVIRKATEGTSSKLTHSYIYVSEKYNLLM